MQFKFIEGKGCTLYIMENILINLNGANCNTLTVDYTPILITILVVMNYSWVILRDLDLYRQAVLQPIRKLIKTDQLRNKSGATIFVWTNPLVMNGECRNMITIIDYNSVGLIYMLDNFKLKIMQAFNFWLPLI